jgi:glutathione S-transferase
MRVYQFAYSPFAAKVRKCLELKHLTYQVVEVPYLDRRELLAVSGGWAHVPVLVDGHTVVTDSPRITAYLDERYEPSLRPGTLVGAATVYEQWADQVLEDVAFRLAAPHVEERMAALNGGREDARAMYRLVKERKFGPGCIDAWRAAGAELGARLAALLHPLGGTLAVQPFLLGERPTLADAAVWGNLYMVESVLPGRVASIGPALGEWYRRVGDAGAPREAR